MLGIRLLFVVSHIRLLESLVILQLIFNQSIEVSNTELLLQRLKIWVQQSNWSIDTADGNGPSDLIWISMLLMAYIDYFWYGAGKIVLDLRN